MSRSADTLGFTGPVFLVGAVRSGTKLLRDLMNRNPAIGIPISESHFIPSLIDRFGRSADFSDDGALRRVHAHLRGTNFFTNMRDRGVELSWDDLAGVRDRGSWAPILTHVFRFYAPEGRREGFVWGDKTPTYARQMPLLKSLFPAARFIHIHRDPRDCCLSVRRAWGKSVYRAASEWSRTIELARASGESLGSDYLEVSYEGLLADPAAVLQRVSRFLDLEFVSEMVTLDRATEDLGDARDSGTVVRDNRTKYRRELPVKEVRRIEEIVLPAAVDLGYELDYDVTYRPLGKLGSLLLAAHDALASAKFYARRKGLRGGLSYIWRFHTQSGWLANRSRASQENATGGEPVGWSSDGHAGLRPESQQRRRQAARPAIVEIVGPAGSGKSTLTRALLARNGQILEGKRLDLARLRDLPFVLRKGLAILPECCPVIGWRRRATREELKKMIYLSGWGRVLARERARSRAVLLLDQGPLFNLATLQAFGGPRLAGDRFERWSDRMIERWKGLVDLVIRLDAEDSSLIERIRGRQKEHEIKDGSVGDMKSYLNDYRSAYDDVIGRITRGSAVDLVALDTDRLTPERTVEAVEKALGRFG